LLPSKLRPPQIEEKKMDEDLKDVLGEILEAMPKYQICSHNNQLYRLDAQTGKIERLHLPGGMGGVEAVEGVIDG
jgi:hypothetical protein